MYGINSSPPVGTDWKKLQRLFYNWFSKLDQILEEVFQKCRSFYLSEATDTIDSYVHPFGITSWPPLCEPWGL